MEPTRHSIPLPNPDKNGRHDLVFYDWGDPLADHVVVCVHGLTRNARDFDLLAQALAQRGRRVFTLSMAGRGESAWLENPMDYTYATYIADCLKLLDNFHLRQVDWVGTSMGGIIGMAIASAHPARIRKLVLNDIGTLLRKEALERIYAYVQSIPTSFADRAEADAYLREVFKPFGINDLPVWEPFVDSSLLPAEGGRVKLACDPAILEPVRAETKNFTEINEINIGNLWEKVLIPTLILRGENSDILDAQTVSAMRATNHRAVSRTIPDVGHAPSLMVPEQISLVADWLVSDTNKLAGI